MKLAVNIIGSRGVGIKAQAKLGTPLMDDDLRGVTQAGSDLESATGTSPVSNPSGARL